MISHRHTIVRSNVAVLTIALLGIGLLAGVFAAPAATQAGPAYQAAAPRTVTIAAGASLTMKVRGFCLDFGKPFPTGATTANDLGANAVRGALNYAIGKGYADTNAEQVQLAIWYLRDNTWHNESHTIAQEIVDNANSSTPVNGTGTSLADAVTARTVTVSATFVPQTADAFYGDGNLEIRNVSNAEVNIYLPVGTVFTAGTTGEFQDLLAYELAAAQPGTPGATTTVSGTTTVTGTTTAVATTEVTETATVAATTTVTGTAQATGTVAVETITPAATTTTAVETATPEATATTEVTVAPTIAATSTPLPGSQTLPQTGGPDALTIAVLLIAMAIGLGGLGLMLRYNPRT